MKTTSLLIISGILLIAATLAIISCSSSSDNITVPSFQGERSFEYLEKQVAFGPRVPGSRASSDCRQYLVDFFINLGAGIDTMVFIHNDKLSNTNVIMVNLIARFYGSDSANSDNILLAAHYDSRPRAEYDPDLKRRDLPIDGANDGASGVAVLMELGNLLAKVKPRVNIDLAFLDGEDWGEPGDLNEYFLGAREMIRRNIKGHYKFALVIDMIGDKDLQVFREEYSQKYYPEISDMVWKTAAKLKEKAFVDSIGYAIQDDHLSFMTIDLPSAVIIDFNYPSWHTAGDTPDKCSPASLGAVGRVLTQLLYGL